MFTFTSSETNNMIKIMKTLTFENGIFYFCGFELKGDLNERITEKRNIVDFLCAQPYYSLTDYAITRAESGYAQ